eukprot:3525646-Karenia_brevis.AAC.1
MEPVLEQSWTVVPGRATAARVSMGPKGGMVLISAYLQDTIGPVGENWVLLLRVAELIHSLGTPWAVGADWNCSPDELEASGWLGMIGGSIMSVSSGIGTCRTKTGRYTNLDYFVVPVYSAPMYSMRGVVRDAGIKPHRPVQMAMSSHPRQYMMRTLQKILQFPLKPPCRPSRMPHQWPAWEVGCLEGATEAHKSTVLNNTCCYVMRNVERELLDMYDIPAAEQEAHSGRGEMPRYRMVPCLGSRAQGYALKLGPDGRWWRSVAQGLEQIRRLLHSSRGKRNEHVPLCDASVTQLFGT